MEKSETIIRVDSFSAKHALEEVPGTAFHLPSTSNQGSRVAGANFVHATDTPTPLPLTSLSSTTSISSTQRTNVWRSLKRKADADGDKGVSSLLNCNIAAKRLHVDVSTADLGFCRTLWIGLKRLSSELKMDGSSPVSVEQLLAAHPSLRLVPWNGRDSMKVLDKHNRVIVHLGGRPRSKSFKESMKTLDAEMEAARRLARMPDVLPIGKGGLRGDHPCGTYGYTYPSLKNRPALLKNGDIKGHLAALTLATSKAALRVKGMQASFMKNAAPRMYDLYCETDRFVRANALGLEDELQEAMPFLDSPGSFPFASVTYNFGSHTVCNRHRDCMNFAPGWCAVTAVGRYDPKRGGHLVLWELGLVIEFPPGATILLPSALITHFNTAIRPTETRRSIVRYSAGGIFMWAERYRNGEFHDSAVPPVTTGSPEKPPTLDDYLQLYMTADELDEQAEVFQL